MTATTTATALNADAIKAERHRRRLSLTAMAELVGCDRQTYHRWETGERIPSGPADRRLRELMAEPAPIPTFRPKRIITDAWEPADDAVPVRLADGRAAHLTLDPAWAASETMAALVTEDDGRVVFAADAGPVRVGIDLLDIVNVREVLAVAVRDYDIRLG